MGFFLEYMGIAGLNALSFDLKNRQLIDTAFMAALPTFKLVFESEVKFLE